MDYFHAQLIQHPDESYSRQLNKIVAAEEKPYGYDTHPPAAGHENPGVHEMKFFNINRSRKHK